MYIGLSNHSFHLHSITLPQQVYNLVIFFVWKSFTYSYWRHYQPISSHLSSIEEENNLGHILYIFISLTLGRVQVFCQILSNERGFKKLMLYGNVTQIVLFLYWAKMTANWLVVSPVRVCERFSYKKLLSCTVVVTFIIIDFGQSWYPCN